MAKKTKSYSSVEVTDALNQLAERGTSAREFVYDLLRIFANYLDMRNENFWYTLGKMYNPESMPEKLREAHHALDMAVERIYRAEPFASDEERLEHLFKLYARMTNKSAACADAINRVPTGTKRK